MVGGGNHAAFKGVSVDTETSLISALRVLTFSANFADFPALISTAECSSRKVDYGPNPFEVHRFGKYLINPVAYIPSSEPSSGRAGGKFADRQVTPLNLYMAAGLELHHPMQLPGLKKLDEIFRSKPIVEERPLNFETTLKGVFHKVWGRLYLSFERNPFLKSLSFFELEPEFDRMAVSFWAHELRSDDIVRQHISLLAVIPENTDAFHLLAGLMSQGVVNNQPSLSGQSALSFENVDSGIIDLLMFPDTGGEESVKRTRMSGLDKKPIDALHSEIFRNDQSERITLEMLKSGRPEILRGLSPGLWGCPPQWA